MLTLASPGSARSRDPQANCSQRSWGALLKSTADSIIDSSTNHRIIEHLVFSFKHNGPALGHEMTKGPAQLNSSPNTRAHAHVHRHIHPDHAAHATLQRPPKHNSCSNILITRTPNLHSANRCDKPTFTLTQPPAFCPRPSADRRSFQ